MQPKITYAEAARWLVAGFAVWFPANAIADELPVLVHQHGRRIAALVTVAFQVGNVPLLAMKAYIRVMRPQWLETAVALCLLVGLVAVFEMMLAARGSFAEETGGRSGLAFLASVMAGAAGAVGSCCLWALAADVPHPRATKNLSIGMALSCVVSGVLILSQRAGQHPDYTSKVYFALVFVVFGCSSLLVSGAAYFKHSRNSGAPEPALLEEPDEPPPEPAAAEPMLFDEHRLHVLFGTLYFANYFAPAFLPFVLDSTPQWTYRAVLVSCNAGDLFGRLWLVPGLLVRHVSVVAAWLVLCTVSVAAAVLPGVVAALLPGPLIAAVPVYFFAVTYARGTLITAVQLELKKAAGAKAAAATAGMSGQLGGFVGALVGLLIIISSEPSTGTGSSTTTTTTTTTTL